MAIKSSREIYRVLEEAIRASATPMTCVDLLEIDKIRKWRWPNMAKTCV